MYADTCTDSMRIAIEESNRRREKQVRYNMEHEMLPRKAQRSGSGQSLLLGGAEGGAAARGAVYDTAEDMNFHVAADTSGTYSVESPTGSEKDLDALIERARSDMERAAKELDFLAAAHFRDRMYELRKLKEQTRNDY